MKTVLIATHQISFSSPQSLHNCLGVLTLSACLKRRSLECEVLDLIEFSRLRQQDAEETLNAIACKIVASQPDILGFSTMTNNLAIALDVARRVKNILPKCLVVFGGPGTAFCAKTTLENFTQVDFIFRGEADFVFPDFVESMHEDSMETILTDKIILSIPGLVYRGPGGIVDNGWPEGIKNLDELPCLDYPFREQSYAGQNSESYGDYNGVSVEVGRGCPFTCTFCSTSEFFKRKYRLKSVDRVLDEIAAIRQKLGSARIIFSHDLLTLKRNYVFELCRGIKTRLPGLVWKCHARLDTLDGEMLAAMSDAGCNEIFVGLESATEKMQKVVNKRLDIHKFGIPLENAVSLNIRFGLSFIVGFPEEDDDDIAAIFAYALKAKRLCRDMAQVKIHTLAPLVGSPLYEKYKDRLSFDDYGSVAATDIPLRWGRLREMMKPFPEIFSLYFHLPIDKDKRIKSLKFEYLGLVIEKLMPASILLACEGLGDTTASFLVQNIDHVTLPDPDAPDSQYPVMADSLRLLLLNALPDNVDLKNRYDAMARYEIALLEARASKNDAFLKIIEARYSPDELLEYLQSPGDQPLNAKLNTPKATQKNYQNGGKISQSRPPGDPKDKGQKRFFMIFKDKNDHQFKHAEVAADFAGLVMSL